MVASDSSKRPVLMGMQLLRAVAAIAVIAHHANIVLANNAGYAPFWSFAGVGSRGVELFFVLSGFIIMYAHWNDERTPAKARRYATNRIVRILPPAFIVASGWLGIVWIAGGAGFDVSSVGELSFALWASSALILPMLTVPSPIVIWTLKHEMIFYGIFLSRYISRWFFLVLVAGWAAVSLNVQATPGHQASKAFLLSLNVLFGFGVLAYFASRTAAFAKFAASPLVLPAVAITAAAFLALSFASSAEDAYDSMLPVAFGALGCLLLLACLPLQGDGPVARIFVFLGDASYGIYLVHFPVIIILYKVLEKLPLPDFANFLVLFAAGLITGVIFYVIIEKPVTQYLRRRFSPRVPATS